MAAQKYISAANVSLIFDEFLVAEIIPQRKSSPDVGHRERRRDDCLRELMVVIENRRQILAERIICGQLRRPDVLPSGQLVVVVIQITYDRFVVPEREIELDIDVALDHTLRIVGQTRGYGHVLETVPDARHVFHSGDFGEQVVVKTHRQRAVFLEFGQNLQRVLHLEIKADERVELLHEVDV